MKTSPYRREVLTIIVQFFGLTAAAILGTAVFLHLELLWLTRFLGIPGTILILLALLYSLRKRKVISWGNPRSLLGLHEVFSWLGALMVLIHAGIHLNALLPWLALMAMIVNVVSGMTGGYLLARSARHLQEARSGARGRAMVHTEKQRFLDAVAHDLMGKWRVIHVPISIAFAVLALGHIISILLFWEWR